MAACYRLNQFTFSTESKQIAIGCNRKRGRPRKTAPALKYQEDIQFVYSDTESEEEDHRPKNKKRKVNTLPDDEEYDLFANESTTSKASSIIEAASTSNLNKSDPKTSKKKGNLVKFTSRVNSKRSCNEGK